MTEYKTTDIVLAATLRVHAIKMKTVEVFGNRGTFVFSDVPDGFIQKYDMDELVVEPKAFNVAIKNLTTSVRRMIQAR